MSETSRRRRWFGRILVAASALALPLTASISYAAANAQPAPPAPPAPPSAELPPAPPAPPAPPEAPEVRNGEVRTMVLRRHGGGGETVVLRHPQGAQNWPQFNWQGDPNSEEFQASMEEFQREMEKFGEEWAEQHAEDWAKYGEQWARYGEQHAAQAQALAQRAQRMAPEVIVHCDDESSPARATRTEDGRQQIVICNAQMNRFARSSLRNARNSIASNREISAEVRNEILEDLDEEIQRIEREDD